MTRRPRDQTFRKADVVRAYRAAVDAGIPSPRVVIDTAARTITIIAGIPGSEQTPNEWDEVCDTAAGGPNK